MCINSGICASRVTLLYYSVGPEGKLWRFVKLCCVTLYSSNVNSCPDFTASPQSMIVQENVGWPHAQHLTVDSAIRIFVPPPLRSYIYSPIELLLQPCGLQRMVICSRNGYTTSSSSFFESSTVGGEFFSLHLLFGRFFMRSPLSLFFPLDWI